MHQITSALKPFHICPRCSKFQLKRNRRCKSCGFGMNGWEWMAPDVLQVHFSTGKYFIIQNKNITTGITRAYISSTERVRIDYDNYEPKFRFELDIEISLRATDDDIEKLMLLM